MDVPTYQRLAYEGAAGTGKTHELLNALTRVLEQHPLQSHQRVLALTFMHGSRRRLDARLAAHPTLKRKYLVQTIDAFAAGLVHRRRTLARNLNVSADTFDETCAAAAQIVCLPSIAAWVGASFPIVLIDEFQDVDPIRLSLIQALTNATHALVAADEFQCLDASLLPSTAVHWMHDAFQVQTLADPRRTSDSGLLQAAHAIRSGTAPKPQGGFDIVVPLGPKACAYSIAQTIASRSKGTTAIIAASLKSPIPDVLTRLRNADGMIKQFGRFRIREESSSDERVEELLASLKLTDRQNVHQCAAELTSTGDPELCRLGDWLRRKQSVSPIVSLTDDVVKERLELIVHQTRSYGSGRERGTIAATVHGAKNREFNGVIVFWTFAVPKNADQRRRLLYNAVTRAQSWCVVVPYSKKLLAEPPFT